MKPPPSAVILRDDHIGDLVLTTPLMRALAVNGWDVDVIAARPQIDLIRNSPRVRNCTALQDIAPGWPKNWWPLARHLRQCKYDAVILPFAFPRQLLLASAASGARYRIAMWGGLLGRLTLHTCVKSGTYIDPRPYTQTSLQSLEPLGIAHGQFNPEIFLSGVEVAAAEQLLDGHLRPGIRIAIHPGSLGNTCNLPISVYRKLAQQILAETDWSVVVTGSPNERDLVADWSELAEPSQQRIWLACGATDLRGLAALLDRVDALVVVGTGPLHIANAVGTPTVSPFCPQLPVCATVWGHPPLELSAIEPVPSPCDPQKIHTTHCDFRGSITAADLFARLQRRLAVAKQTSAD